jgi:hypothetical protein
VTEQFGELRARQHARDADLEADEHGFREEVDDGAGAKQVGGEGDQRDEQCRGGREREMARRVAGGERAERRADQQ